MTERRLGPRFGPEAGLILAAAAFAALIELSWPGVVAVVLCAWLAVAVFEIVLARMRPAARDAEPAPAESFAAAPSAQVEPRDVAGELEPIRDAERPSESPQQAPTSLVAAPEQVEPAPPLEQERRS